MQNDNSTQHNPKRKTSDYIKSWVINGDNKKKGLKYWLTPQDTLQTIDMTDCILTSFMKKMQCNALNVKTVTKQVWFYFIYGTT